MVVTSSLDVIKNGDLPDADVVMSNISYVLVEQLKTDLNAFSQGVVTKEQVLWKTANSTLINGSFDETNSTALVGAAADNNKTVYFCTKFDDFEDDSVDATKWSSSTAGEGTVTETSGQLTIYAGSLDGAPETGTASLISDGASGLDFRSFSGNSEVLFYISDWDDVTTGSGTSTIQVQISNGTTHIDTGITGTGYHRIVFNKSAETCDIYEDDASSVSTDNLDISTVTTNWYIRFFVTGNVPSNPGDSEVRMTIQEIGYADGSVGTSDVVFSSTASETSSVGIGIVGTANTTSAPTIAFSADGGVNYTTGAADALVETTDTGTSIKFKVTGAHPTTMSATSKNIMNLTYIGGTYG